MIGLVAVDTAGRTLAAELRAAWPAALAGPVTPAALVALAGPDGGERLPEGLGAGLGSALERLEPGLGPVLGLALGRFRRVVCLAPVPAVVGLLCAGPPDLVGLPAPAGPPDLAGRPALVCVDPERRRAVALAGGAEEARALAAEVSAALGTRPVGAGEPAGGWLPRFTDLAAAGGAPVVHPRTLTVGVGAGSAARPDEVLDLVLEALAAAGLAPASVARLATVDGKADHPAVRRAASLLDVPVVGHPAAALAAVRVPNPSAGVRAAVGTASVAEAAALLGAPGGRLVAPKRKSGAATAAIARAATTHGRLAVVGLHLDEPDRFDRFDGPGRLEGPDRFDGPGRLDGRGAAELRRASLVVGAPGVLDRLAPVLRPTARRLTAEDHLDTAVALATQGQAVVLAVPGDASAPPVEPGPYDLVRVPAPPLPRAGDPS
ncbi:cobalamin biosynthesis protein [Kitasatospora sp. NPDC058170]|uniref:cobalamin biosynthesis protein n=1 Tax=Kitasatospora sp. NPDC058170 TaxID=3346364 RepID=UPI0036D848D6